MDFRPLRFALLVALLGPLSAARADELDDELARRFTGIVRDTTQSRATRVAAAKALGGLGPRAAAAVPDLVAQLGRLDGTELEPLQIAVIDCLGEIGVATRPALPDLVRCSGRSTDIDRAIKRATAAVIGAGESRETAVLRRQLTSRDASVRLRAVKAFEGPASAAAATELRTALTDADGDVRRAAQSMLLRLAPAAVAANDLAASYAMDLADPDAAVRLVAVKRLGRLGKAAGSAAPAVDALLTSDPDRDVRRAAAEALAAFAGP